MSTISASTTTTTAYKVTADTTGTLVLQTGSTPTTAVTIGTDQKVAFAAGISNGLNVSGSGWGVLPYVSSSLVVDNNAGQARFFATGDASNFGSYIWYGGKTGGSTSTYMAIDTGGNVSVGTASAATKFTVSGNGSFLASSQLRFYNSNNTNWSYIDCPATDGTGPLRFTVGSGEAGRFDNSGNLLVNTTSPAFSSGGTSYTVKFAVDATNQTNGVYFKYSSGGSFVVLNNTLGSSTRYYFSFDNGNTRAGDISYNGSVMTYGGTSDYRLKENVQPIQNGLSRVMQMNPVSYTWKHNGMASEGFLAHEIQAISPDAVSGEKDAVDQDGNPQYQQVDPRQLVCILAAAIKEQQAIIETLTNRITALEAK